MLMHYNMMRHLIIDIFADYLATYLNMKGTCHRPPLTMRFVSTCPLVWGIMEGHVTV